MKTLIFLVFSMLGGFAQCADDVDKLVEQLKADSFDVRVEATSKLSELGPEYITRFISLGDTIDNIEVRYRLYEAAKNIYISKVLIEESDWLKLNGEAYIYGNTVSLNSSKNEAGETEYTRGFVIDFIGSESAFKEKINQWDVVIAVDGEAFTTNNETTLILKAGRMAKITVRRYRDVSNITGYYNFPLTAEFDVMTFEARVGWKDKKFISQLQADATFGRLYRQYLFDHFPDRSKPNESRK